MNRTEAAGIGPLALLLIRMQIAPIHEYGEHDQTEADCNGEDWPPWRVDPSLRRWLHEYRLPETPRADCPRCRGPSGSYARVEMAAEARRNSAITLATTLGLVMRAMWSASGIDSVLVWGTAR